MMRSNSFTPAPGQELAWLSAGSVLVADMRTLYKLALVVFESE